jgi:SAM-dependent methyltransferase
MPRDHWPAHARSWARIGPPLRPSPEDVAIFARAAGAHAAPRALLLGVTPELATMAWPAGTVLTAIDRSPDMIGALFPAGAGDAITGEWDAIPRPDGAFDVIVGDGCPSNLAYPAQYAAVGAELRRVLAPGGTIAIRLFALPERPETLDDVARDLRAGRIAGFHALKWRIAMAVQPADRNVRVADILAGLEAIAPDRAALPWPAETVATIEHYRGSDVVYSFPTAAEQLAALGLEATLHHPGYELGERCPVIVSRPRPGRADP